MAQTDVSAQTDRIAAVAQDILQAFEAGAVPRALAQLFIGPQAPEDAPRWRWSWGNQMIAILQGHWDARGFRQWKNVGRSVRKGERAFAILGPVTRRAKVREIDPDSGEEIEHQAQICTGFKAIPVFGYNQTEGPSLLDEHETRFLETLPLIEVARAWEIDVHLALPVLSKGAYSKALQKITLSVKNLSTWAHELIHAADDRRVGLKPGQVLEQEVVAELGGAILLECLGYSTESDRGGAWEYIRGYAEQSQVDAIRTCYALVDRACGAVRLLLETAEIHPAA